MLGTNFFCHVYPHGTRSWLELTWFRGHIILCAQGPASMPRCMLTEYRRRIENQTENRPRNRVNSRLSR
jgi:hypothetical protein